MIERTGQARLRVLRQKTRYLTLKIDMKLLNEFSINITVLFVNLDLDFNNKKILKIKSDQF